MADARGLSLETRSDRCAEARRFLGWLGERGSPQDLPDTTAHDIDTYMMVRAKSLRRTTLNGRATELRSFLRYLHATGRLLLEPSTAVIIPRLYTFESIPSALGAEDIKVVVDETRKDRSPKGLRDFAILTLLTGYGLRAGEITSLRLEDVGWRSEILRIRHSKTSAHSEFPLLPEVGNAILDYLRKGRPKSLAREIFIRTCAPYRALKNGSSLHRLISLRLNAAGIEPRGKRGPHAFRHARAIAMLRAGVTIKEIGDVLGHRSADSTNIYLKLASEDLRAVALEIPVEVNA
jgi:site-specific recombinase XerD